MLKLLTWEMLPFFPPHFVSTKKRKIRGKAISIIAALSSGTDGASTMVDLNNGYHT